MLDCLAEKSSVFKPGLNVAVPYYWNYFTAQDCNLFSSLSLSINISLTYRSNVP